MKTVSEPSLDVARVRAEFPALDETFEGRRMVYLDSACTALKLKRAADKAHEFSLRLGGCGGKRSTHLASQAAEEALQEARAEVAGHLGADSPNAIAWTSGTTEAVNWVARGFPYPPERREVVISDLEHNSVFLPFYDEAQRGGVELKICPSRDGRVDLDRLEALVTTRTALVAVTRASNVYGGVQPLDAIVRLAHSKGARVLADMAQYLPTHREDVAARDVDFAAFSGHKLGAPFGIGALYGKERLLNSLGPVRVGGGTVRAVAWGGSGLPEVSFLDAPQRLEGGVGNFAGAVGLAEAIRYSRELPETLVRAHLAGLVRRAADGLSRYSQVRVLGRPERLAEGSLVSFVPVHPEFSVADFNLFLNHELDGRFIAVRAGEHCAHLLHRSLKIAATVRASFFAYNTAEEVDLYVDAVGAYLKEACP